MLVALVAVVVSLNHQALFGCGDPGFLSLNLLVFCDYFENKLIDDVR